MSLDNALQQLAQAANAVASQSQSVSVSAAQLVKLSMILQRLVHTLAHHSERLGIDTGKTTVKKRLPMGVRDLSGRNRAKAAMKRAKPEPIVGRRDVQVKEEQ